MKNHPRKRTITGLVLGLQVLTLFVLGGAVSRLAAAEPLQGIGNTYQWPANGELDPGEDLWVSCETWPIGSASVVEVVYSVDGGSSWSVAPLGASGQAGDKDLWQVDLGGFPEAGVIQYAVVAEDAEGNVLWDNNGGGDYTALVTPLQITHTPGDASLSRHDDLLVVFDAPGAALGYASVEVVFSMDGGDWLTVPMARTAAGDIDRWEGNLGRFFEGTRVRYALAALDAAGVTHWFNAGGEDYFAIVAAGGYAGQVPLLTESDAGVSVSSVYNSNYPGWRAFDGNPSRYWFAAPSQPENWVAYDFGAATRIDRYTVTSAGSYAPMDFELQGSNGDGWVTLDTRSGESLWTFQGPRSFVLPAQAEYQKYRLWVTEDNSGAAGTGVSDLLVGELALEQLPAASPAIGSDTGSGELVIAFDGAGDDAGYALVEVVYSADGANWSAAALELTRETGYDHWEVNLGGFPAGSTIQYALVATAADGGQQWFSNGGADYIATMAPPAITDSAAGQSLTLFDDLVVSFDGTGVERGFTQVDVVYQYSHDVPNWRVEPMELTVGAEVDHWEAKLGKFLPGTVVHYALVATDAAGGQHWFNNGGGNYTAVTQPTFVSALVPYPQDRASSSGDYSSTYPAWKAFDGSYGNSTGSWWYSALNVSPAWLSYQFDQPTRIDRYTLHTFIGAPGPRDFELQGSDGGGWVTLDVRSGETGWTSSGRSYTVASPGAYQSYRLVVTEDNDGAPGSGVNQIVIQELTLERAPDVWIGNLPVSSQDDLVVTFGAAGSQVGYATVEVVYSSDYGASWSVAPMQFGEEAGYERWEANLGSFAAGTQVRYALVATDASGNPTWFNNNSRDYYVTVSP